MAIVELCRYCREGHHSLCAGGTGGELGPDGVMTDGLLVCCTCKICAKRRREGETGDKEMKSLAQTEARDIISSLDPENVGSLAELRTLLEARLAKLNLMIRTRKREEKGGHNDPS